MTPEFIAAVIDTLLPGDEALPAGSLAGLDRAAYAQVHRPVFAAIDAQAFLRADTLARSAMLQAVERAAPEAFRALLVAALSDYYESAAVLAALGWRAEPPQPAGHAPAAMDEATRAALQRVAGRGRLWRG